MDTRQRSDPSLRLHGSISEQRGGRIPIHSLLSPASEAESSSTEQTPSSTSQASSSHRSPSTTFTPLNTHHYTPARGSPVSTSLRPTPGLPAGAVHDDVRTNHAALAPSLAAADMQGRTPRTPRPSYSEEQKFYIMYARIMKDQTWPEIEDQFNLIFGTRTKGGLTSVYYRVRKDWGLMEVLKSGPDSFKADCDEVERRARNFSAEFLAQIGYIP